MEQFIDFLMPNGFELNGEFLISFFVFVVVVEGIISLGSTAISLGKGGK